MNRILSVALLAALAFYAVLFWTEPMFQGSPEPYNFNRLQAFYNILLLPEQVWNSWHELSPEEREYSAALGFAPNRDALAAYLNAQNSSVLPINRLSVLLIAWIQTVWIIAFGHLILRFVSGSHSRLRKIIHFDATNTGTEGDPKQNGSRLAGNLLYFGLAFLIGAAGLGALVGCLGLLGHATGFSFYSGWIFWPLLASTVGIAIFVSAIPVIADVSLAAWRTRVVEFAGFFNIFNNNCKRDDLAPGICPSKVAFALSALFLIYTAMQPPLEFDVREYHLQAAKEFYQLGALDFLPHNAYANMPLGMDSLALASMCLAGDWFLGALAGKVLIVLFALVIVMILCAAGHRLTGSWTPGTLAGLIFLSIPVVWENATFGLVDAALGAYFLAVVCLMFVWDHFVSTESQSGSPSGSPSGLPSGLPSALNPTENQSDLQRLTLLIGLLVGGAIAVKYTAVVFLAVPALIWFGFRTGSVDVRTRVRVLAYYLAGILLVGGVWYAKNAILIGNPVYPLAQSVFGNVVGNGLTADALEHWNRVHAPKSITNAELVQLGAFHSWKDWGLGTLFVPSLIGIALLWPQWPRWVRLSLLFVSVYLFLWFFLTHRIVRFTMPIYPIILLPVGWSLWIAREKMNPIGRNLLTGLLTTGLLFCFLYQALIGSGINDYLAPLSEARVHPFRMTLGEDRILFWLTKSQNDTGNCTKREAFAPPQRVERTPILLIGDAAVFGWSVPIQYATCFNAEPMLANWLRNLDPQLAQTISGSKTGIPESGNQTNGKSALTSSNQKFRSPDLVVVNWLEIDRYRHSDYGYCPWFTRELVAQLIARGRLTKIPFKTMSLPAPGSDVPNGSGSVSEEEENIEDKEKKEEKEGEGDKVQEEETGEKPDCDMVEFFRVTFSKKDGL